MAGLGLLPCYTVFAPQKTRTRVEVLAVAPPFKNTSLSCYEIHMGLTKRTGGVPFARFPDGREEGTAAGPTSTACLTQELWWRGWRTG